MKPIATFGHKRGMGPNTAQAGSERCRSDVETISTIISSAGEKFHVEQKPEACSANYKLTPEIDKKDGNVSRGDAGNTGGLGDGGGAIALQFLAAFDGQRLNFVKIEVSGNLDILQTIILFGLLFLTFDIAFIFDGNLNGLDNLRRKCSTWNNSEKVRQRKLGASGKIG